MGAGRCARAPAGIHLLVLDAIVKRLPSVAALGQHMQTHASDMLLRAEVIGTIDLLAIDFQFQQPEIVYPHAVASPQMTAYHSCQLSEHRHYRPARGPGATAHLLDDLPRFNGLIVYCHGTPTSEIFQRRSVFFHHFVFHCLFSYIFIFVQLHDITIRTEFIHTEFFT